jgi:hypothetical protein
VSRIYGEAFAIVPEWLLDAEVSDRAVRLYAILARYAGAEGRAYPGRPKLAERLRCGVSSVDRAVDELVAVEAVVVEPHYRADGSRAANSYWLWPRRPPVEGALPTGEQGPPPAVTAPLPTGRAASRNESQVDSKPDVPRDSQVSPSSAAALHGFDQFWSAYPRHTAKEAARKAWAAAMAKVTDPAVIVEGAQRFAADPNRVEQFTPHPATWLNAGRWDDDPLPSRTQATNGRAPARRIDTDRSAPSGRITL